MLVKLSEDAVKWRLETYVAALRDNTYDPPRDRRLVEAVSELYIVGELSPACQFAVVDVIQREGLEKGRILVPNAGDGKGAIALARSLPEAEVYGLETIERLVAAVAVELGGEGRPGNLHIAWAPPHRGYTERDFSSADATVVPRACGPAADRLLKLAVSRKHRMVAERTCCPHAISQYPEETPAARAVKGLAYLRNELHAVPFAVASDGYASRFLASSLGVTAQEFNKIAAASAVSSEGARVIECDRALRLLETKSYDVLFDEAEHFLVALRREPVSAAPLEAEAALSSPEALQEPRAEVSADKTARQPALTSARP